jgi:AbrB family looped-hinge helix DNA binding protein
MENMPDRQFVGSVSPKGQITLPQAIRQLLGVQPKDKVRIKVEGHEVKVTPLGSPMDASFQAVSALKKPLSLEQMTEIAHDEHAEEAALEGRHINGG